ncbi:MAG: DUF3788 family protein [Spirochaetaceae bacterium]|nr:DUF3788 family protein [Spirochaetaceae bacterium]
MEKRALGDPSVYPSDDILQAHLGRSKAAFSALFERARATLPELETSWKYYNDGKSWLLKASRKKKTLFWLSVDEGRFRTTFYLGPRADDAVMSAGLPHDLVARFREDAGKKFRGLTLVVKTKKDIAVFEKLLAIKVANL